MNRRRRQLEVRSRDLMDEMHELGYSEGYADARKQTIEDLRVEKMCADDKYHSAHIWFDRDRDANHWCPGRHLINVEF